MHFRLHSPQYRLNPNINFEPLPDERLTKRNSSKGPRISMNKLPREFGQPKNTLTKRDASNEQNINKQVHTELAQKDYQVIQEVIDHQINLSNINKTEQDKRVVVNKYQVKKASEEENVVNKLID